MQFQLIFLPYSFLTPQNPRIEHSFPSVFIVHTVHSLLASSSVLSFFLGFAFIPVVIYLPVISDISLILVSCSCSCHLSPVPPYVSVSLVKCCCGFIFLLFIICYPSSICLQSCIFIVIILGYMFIWLLGFDSVFVLSPTSLLPCVFVPCYLGLPGLWPLVCWLRFLPCPLNLLSVHCASGSFLHLHLTIPNTLLMI